jgi:hypothetical protein
VSLRAYIAFGSATIGTVVFWAFCAAAAVKYIFSVSSDESLLLAGLPVAVLVLAIIFYQRDEILRALGHKRVSRN